MAVFISLLRGINVSGQKRIRMEELLNLYESLGFTNVTTYIQSGNVVFGTGGEDTTGLAPRIESAIEQAFGFSVVVFNRQSADFQRILAGNPFLIDRQEDPAKLHVTFLYHPPDAARLEELVVPPGETAEFVLGEQEIFLYYPDGYGRTKFSNNTIERKLALPATTRNWNTVRALYDLAAKIGG